MQDDTGSDADHDFISSSLLSRLSDEDPSVLLAVLNLGPQVSSHCSVVLV